MLSRAILANAFHPMMLLSPCSGPYKERQYLKNLVLALLFLRISASLVPKAFVNVHSFLKGPSVLPSCVSLLIIVFSYSPQIRPGLSSNSEIKFFLFLYLYE